MNGNVDFQIDKSSFGAIITARNTQVAVEKPSQSNRPYSYKIESGYISLREVKSFGQTSQLCLDCRVLDRLTSSQFFDRNLTDDLIKAHM
jgi:hypothetical protein